MADSNQIDNDSYYQEPDLPNINTYSKLIAPNVNQLEESQIIHLEKAFGFDLKKRQNVCFLNNETLVSILGNDLLFFDLNSAKSWTWHGLREGNLGAMALHPSEPYIAVAESNNESPIIYILNWQKLAVYRMLQGGTTTSYSDLAFSHNGNKLASVGSYPDYLLTVWDWRQQKIELRSKAFSQDVYKVAFSPERDDVLVTSGMGHIRFWTLSSTFTGLKLQGQIGKFGATELSDIVSFIQLPMGKVLSTTETGNLLVWDDGKIKFEIAAKNKKPCHAGRVEGVYLFDSEIYSIGIDGYLRIWDLEAIDAADLSTQSTQGLVNVARVVELEPIDQILINKEAHLVGLVRVPGSESDFILQDANGCIFRLDKKLRSSDALASFHSGKITGLCVSQASHTVSTLGEDGSLHLHELLNNSTKWTSSHRIFRVGGAAGTALASLPRELDRSSGVFVAGFADGVLRIFAASDSLSETALLHVAKPHKSAIKSVAVSLDGRLIVTTSAENNMFFFRLIRFSLHNPEEELDPTASVPFSRENTKLVPIGYLTLSSLGVSRDSQKLGKLHFAPDNHERDFELPTGSSGANTKVPYDDSLLDQTLEKELHTPGVAYRLILELEDGSIRLLQMSGSFLQLRQNQEEIHSFELPSSIFQILPWQLEQNSQQLEQQIQQMSIATSIQQSKKSEDAEDDKQTAAPAPLVRNRGDNWLVTAVEYIEGGHVIMGLKHTVQIDNEDPKVCYEVRAARLDRPRRSRLLVQTHEAVTFLKFTSSQLYLLIGTANGTVCVLPLRVRDIILKDFIGGHDYEPAVHGKTWVYAAHKGPVAAVASTFDDSFFVSAGEDGAVFSFKNESQSVLPESADVVTIGDQAVDITDSSAYTIEDTRRRLEQDRFEQMAKRKREEKRILVQTLKDEFARLKNAAGADNSYVATVDPYLHEQMQNYVQTKKAEIATALAWSSEKAQLSLSKVKQYFLKAVDSRRQTVHAIGIDLSLSTFRTLQVDQQFQSPQFATALSEAHDSGRDAANPEKCVSARTPDSVGNFLRADFSILTKSSSVVSGNPARMSPNVSQRLLPTDTATVDAATGVHEQPSNNSDQVKTPHRHLDTRDEAKSKRLEQWKALLERKPNDSTLDPQEEKLMDQARNSLGDFKLKSDPNYTVSVDEQVDANSKQVEAQLLVHSIHNLQVKFNSRVLSLSHQRDAVISELDAILPELVELYAKSGSQPSSWPASIKFLKPAEISGAAETTPELRQVASVEYERLGQRIERMVQRFDAQIDALVSERSLLEADIKFAQVRLLLLQREWALLKEFEKQDVAIEEKFRDKAQERNELAEKIQVCEDKLLAKKQDMSNIQVLQRELVTTFQKSFASGPASKHADYLLKVFKRKTKRRKTPAGNQSRKRINWSRVGTAFQASLAFGGSRPETTMQDILRQVTTAGSVVLGDNSLLLASSSHEAGNNGRETADSEFGASRGGDSALMQSRIGDGDQNELVVDDDDVLERDDSLSAAGSNPSDVEDDLSGGDLDNSGSLDELGPSGSSGATGTGFGNVSGGADEDFEEVKPADIDISLWQQLLQMRDTRVDLDGAVADVQKVLDTVKKEYDMLHRKQRIAESALQAVVIEAQDFRTMKQRRLNELDIIVLLRLHQIQVFNSDALSLPEDLSKVLVMQDQMLDRLEGRIRELHTEKIGLRKQQKDLHKFNVSLAHSKEDKEQTLAALNKKLEDVQMLKFGHLVDLDKLEQIGQNKDAEDLQKRLREFDRERDAEVREMKKFIENVKNDLLKETRRNTEILEKVVQLSNSKKHIESELNASQQKIKANFSQLASADQGNNLSATGTSLQADSDRLQSLVQKQAARIDVLRAEIEDLVRKPMKEYPIKFKHVSSSRSALLVPKSLHNQQLPFHQSTEPIFGVEASKIRPLKNSSVNEQQHNQS